MAVYSKETDRFKHSVLAVAQELHSSWVGTSDVSHERLTELSEWLHWRTGSEGWEPSYTSRSERYDEMVWSLANEAYREAQAEIRKRARYPESMKKD